MGSASVDDLLANFGDPGCYQIIVLAMLWFTMCILSLNNMMTIFTMGPITHHCLIEEGFTTNESIPILENGEFDSCSMYVNVKNHSQGTTSCINGWQYHPVDGEWSIIQEWNLVCDKHYQAALATSVYFAGVTIGCGVFGYLADKIGRKPVILTCLYGHVILAIVTAFSNSFVMYAALRFIDGLVLQGACGSAYVMSVELFLPHRRNFVAIASQVQWPIMLFILSGLFYFVKNWRTLHLVISVPFALTFVYIWFLPESPRWLMATKRVNRAKAELKRFARYNKLPLPPNLGLELESVIDVKVEILEKSRREYGFLDFFRSKKLTIVFFVSCYFFFMSVFNFYAISYSMAALGSNIYLSCCITSLLDLFVTIAMYFVLNRIGRRTVVWVCTLLCTNVCLLVVVLYLTLPPGELSQALITATAALGRAALAAYFAAMPIYVSELSPTVLRTLLAGIANLWGRIGGIAAPQVMLLEHSVWKPLPFLLCAILALISLAVTFLLPETWNKPLPEIPEDVDKLWIKRKRVQHRNGLSECQILKGINI